VTAVQQHKVRALIRLTFADGETLCATPRHRFVGTRGDHVRAGHARPGQQLRTRSGPVAVAKVEVLHGPATVHTLRLDGAHMYYAGRVEALGHVSKD